MQRVEFDDSIKNTLKDLCDLDGQYVTQVFDPNEGFLQTLQVLS